MEIIIVDNYEEGSKKAAEIMLETIKSNPKANLGLATGSTPVRLYELLAKDHKENGTSYKDIQTFNLDEYVGLNPDHPQSYHYFMNHHLFSHLDINKDNVHIPRGNVDVTTEADAYNKLLAENKINLQLLGIGSNGHVGFNEPGTPFDSITSEVNLVQSTIDDNARLFFDGNKDLVPKTAISMGIANINAAEKILLLGFGDGKANAMKALIEGPMTTDLPASALKEHPNFTIILDKAAAKLLSK